MFGWLCTVYVVFFSDSGVPTWAVHVATPDESLTPVHWNTLPVDGARAVNSAVMPEAGPPLAALVSVAVKVIFELNRDLEACTVAATMFTDASSMVSVPGWNMNV